MRSILPVLVTGVALLQLACDENDERTGYSVSIERSSKVTLEDGEHACFAACSVSSLPDARLPDTCKARDAEVEAQPCGFVAGQEEVRVSVAYEVDFESGVAPKSPTLKLYSGTELLATKTNFDFPPQKTDEKGRYRPLAVLKFPVPLGLTNELDFRISVPPGVELATGAVYSVLDAAPESRSLRILECTNPADCELPAGIGAVTVELVTPPGFAGQSVEFATFVDDIPRSVNPPSALSLVKTGTDARGTTQLAIPDVTGQWRIRATVASRPTETSAALVLPGDPQLVLDRSGQNPNFDTPPEIHRAVGEPSQECRRYRVGVAVEDPPANRRAELTTSSGSLGRNGSKLTLSLNSDGEAFTDLQLAATDVSESILLELVVDTTRSVRTIQPLEPVLPLQGGGSLAAASSVIKVGASGIPTGVRLKGTVRTTAGGKFSPASRITIQTKVLDREDEGPCGPAVEASVLTCDPTEPEPSDRGGCFLTPLSVPVAADGSYEVELNAGLCFVGRLEVTALSRVYKKEEAGKCLGELEESTELVAVGTETLTFAE